MKKLLLIPVLVLLSMTFVACSDADSTAQSNDPASNTAQANDPASEPITEQEVASAQQAWGEGIVEIGRAYTEDGNYREIAADHVRNFYAFNGDETVLFKPTLASEDQFRGDFDEALSYFVGTEGTEDNGFAIAPYTDVRWENEGTVIDSDGDMAMAMGNYYFTGTDGNETKVEYSFGYEKDEDGNLKIVLHHSSLPYSPN